MTDIILTNIQNPDSQSIMEKTIISMPVSSFDISASGYFSESIKTSYAGTNQLLTVQLTEGTVTEGYVYYTPLYTEKIDYDVWKQRINKNFQELT